MSERLKDVGCWHCQVCPYCGTRPIPPIKLDELIEKFENILKDIERGGRGHIQNNTIWWIKKFIEHLKELRDGK